MNRILEMFIAVITLLSIPTIVESQTIQGIITDSITEEPIPFASVSYLGKGVGAISTGEGKYKISQHTTWTELTFTAVGYRTKNIKIKLGEPLTLNVSLLSVDVRLNEVVIKPKKEKYRRKNNPAVELMRRVIENKGKNQLHDNNYFQYDKYEKITMSLNDVKPENMDKGMFKKMPFLKSQVEACPETNKLILPISVQETASKEIYRKDPESEKTLVKGINTQGFNKMFTLGGALNAVLADVFQDVNIYDDQIRLLQERFVSPISSINAISFYKYYIMDTTYVANQKCIHLTFVPQNPQDFGFTGHLYVTDDSALHIKKVILNLPIKTGVNFINSLQVSQEFEEMSNGTWGLSKDDMITELAPTKKMQGIQVRRISRYSDYEFGPIDTTLFRLSGRVVREANVMERDDKFWAEVRDVPLMRSEASVNKSVQQLMDISGFKYLLFAAKAFIENSVETGSPGKPSKVDFVPVNTIVGYNSIEGLRLRASIMTTANLNRKWFMSGYVARGFNDNRWKGKGTLEYSFKKKEYTPIEFPRHSIEVTGMYDLTSPTDKFLMTDKDNFLLMLKTNSADKMTYERNLGLTYTHEYHGGFSYKLSAKNINSVPAGDLHYNLNDEAGTSVHDMTTTELSLNIRYSPGETLINSKTKRVPVSFDAPVLTLTQTTGVKGLISGDYNFNRTEVDIWKRFWLSSYGRLDVDLHGGKQWNKVPYPLLMIPPTNTSYFIQVGSGAFSLLNDMEFLNDEYASLFCTYNMGGKLLNRIPLISKLKWREVLGFNMMFGHLSDKNNPNISSGLYKFPEGTYIMEAKRPYMEFTVGIHNIFKLLAVEYVHRLSYFDHVDASRYGFRFAMIASF
jgi:hypothetical protein